MKKILLVMTILLSTFMLFSCENNQENKDESLLLKEESLVENIEVLDEVPDTQEATSGFKGYMWSVEKDDSKVYLFGSIHLASEALYPFDPSVEEAFSSSDHLVLEADVSDMSQILELSEKMLYSGTDTVYNHLSEEGILKYEMICNELNLKPSLLERIQIWALGSNLMALQLNESDYKADSGVDMYFTNQAKKEAKNIIELEGAMFQVNLLSSFSDEVQEEMFISALGTTDETIESFEELYDNYLTGDIDLMTNYLMTEEISSNEAADKAMLEDRNIGMFNKIKTYLETKDDYFVVVGLAHLLGDKSVVALLESEGYKVDVLSDLED